MKRLQEILNEWESLCAEYSADWLKMARLVYLLATEDATDEGGEPCKLWQLSGHASWSAFVIDILELPPPAASQMRWVWEIYHLQLGIPVEKLVKIGKSKLALALGAVRLALEQENGEELEALLNDLEEMTYAALNDKLAAKRGGGAVVRFLRRPIELNVSEVKSKIESAQRILVFDSNIDSQVKPSSMLVIISDVSPDDAAYIERRLRNSLRWQDAPID